jgi:hypothetical protein
MDTSELGDWFVCPWCRSDAPVPPVSDPENTTVNHIGGEPAFGVRCHNCGTTVNWRVTPDGIECIRDD